MAERESHTPTYGTNVRINKSQRWATRQLLQLLWHGAPMEPVENILKEYRNADAEYRLDLFLSHRDLRDRFTAIEADEDKKTKVP
jgi:hypothetical protein